MDSVRYFTSTEYAKSLSLAIRYSDGSTTLNSRTSFGARSTPSMVFELYMAPVLFQALRSKKMIKYIKHNTYKSDVFSFGLCSLFAATLCFESVYDDSDNAPADKVVKTVSVGKALLEFQEWGNVILYERQPNGSMKKIGRVNQENIDYDEE